jgi:carbon storage regulator CsrA
MLKEFVMLVLTRKANQQIQIGEGIVITILQVKGNSVRVGIEAPRDVRVLRGELDLKNEGRPAAETVVDQEVVVEQMQRNLRSRSTSARQVPLDLTSSRDWNRSTVMRFPVAEAATDAPIERAERLRPVKVREFAGRR